MSKPRIAVVTSYFPTREEPYRGHSAYQTLLHMTAWATLKVFCPLPVYPRWYGWGSRSFRYRRMDLDYSPPDIPAQYFAYTTLPLLTRPINGHLCLRAVEDAVALFRPDLILNFWLYPDGLASVLLGQRLGVPVVVEALGSDLLRIGDPCTLFWTGRVLRGAARVLAVSEHLRRQAVAFGAHDSKTHVIRNAYDKRIFAPADRTMVRAALGLGQEEEVVLYAGSLVRSKGLLELWEAFAELARRRAKWRLVLVGEGPLGGPLQAMARSAGLEERLRLAGQCSTEEVARWLAAANVFCLPSYSEGMPNVVIEAIACWRPVVACNVGGVGELVNTENGILVAPREVSALSTALEQAMSRQWDPGAIAKTYARSWEQAAEETWEVCSRTLASYPIVYCGNELFTENRTSSHHIAERLAQSHPVLYVEAPGLRAPQATARDFRKLWRKLAAAARRPQVVRPGLWHISVPQIPFRRLPLVPFLNRHLTAARVRSAARALGFHRPLLWINVCHAGFLAGRLGERLRVYYCTDDHSAMPGVDAEIVRRMDEELTRAADVVFAVSRRLTETKKALNPHVVYSPHGVDVGMFRLAADRTLPLPEPARHWRKPVIGYSGVFDGRLDCELLRQLVDARPEWTFAIVGRVGLDLGDLAGRPNLKLTGPVPYQTLPDWMRAFDVCIMPYRPGPFAENANPLKLREYLAAGKPVVSVEMPEAHGFGPRVRIARSEQEFLAYLDAAVQEGDERSDEGLDALSWDARLEEVLAVVAQRLRDVER